MTYPVYLSRYIAPSCFVGVRMNRPEGPDVVAEMFEWRTLDLGRVLPAFTYRELCRDFFEAYHAGTEQIPPRPLTLDAFALAEVVEDLAATGLKNVVLDPQAIAPGRWGRPSRVMTAGYCRRFAIEVRPGLEKLFAEKAAELEGGFNKPEDLLTVKDLCAPFVSDVTRDAHARTSEWEV